MKTRFDETKVWQTGDGRTIAIIDMETSHLMNILRMFVKKPNVVMSMIVADIDEHSDEAYYSGVWKPGQHPTLDVRVSSLHNVTSMSFEELKTYAIKSPLGDAISAELTQRGVNVDNLLTEWGAEELADE